ncbi:MAG: redox-sensing transcriptional repressor Rex [Clostridia bacterium]|jgi:redox-sensing transcriptional repressor|nr:redox-sensing transcriptional repressor Rex [Clostridia bacterium]
MKATLGRLPIYLQYLKSLDTNQYANISATIIAKSLGLGEVQVRKDLSAVSGAGRPKLGYETAALIKTLEDVLGQRSVSEAIIVGAGRLGNALLGYNGFGNYGLKIGAAFDIGCKEAYATGNGANIYPLDELDAYCKREKVKIGIITVPKEAAQDICDRLVECGVTAIWNFAPCNLNVPEHIILQHENLALSLAHLKLQMDCK